MTFGLYISNGLEAVVLADTRGSSQSRHGDGHKKIVSFDADNYHGAVFTAGSANLGGAVFSQIEDKADSITDFVKNLSFFYKQFVDRLDTQFLASKKAEIEKKANILQQEKNESYVDSELSKAMQEYDQHKRDPSHSASFYFVAYDHKSDRIRTLFSDSGGYSECFYKASSLGSGVDGAQVYTMTKMNGIEPKHFTFEELIFYSLNSFHSALINEGVGGIPTIAHVSKAGCEFLPTKKIIALTNLTGAYMAELSGLDKAKTRGYVAEILDKRPKYKDIADVLGLNTTALTTLYIPVTSWQAKSNQRMVDET